MVFRKKEMDLDEEEQEEEQELKKMPEVPKPKETMHEVGDVEQVQVDLGNGTFKMVMRVWANEKESAMSDDPLLVLMAKHLFIELQHK